jgi:hypothetical protein
MSDKQFGIIIAMMFLAASFCTSSPMDRVLTLVCAVVWMIVARQEGKE